MERPPGVRRRILPLLLCAILPACSPERHRPPDVLLITLDTFRADRLGPSTPALAHLADRAVRFDAADSPVPLTLPAHASLLSGVLPLHHGLRNNGVGSFPPQRDTLASLLSRKGYRTGAFVGSFILDHRFGLARGFDRYDDEIVRSADESGGTFEAERRGGEVVDRFLRWLAQPDQRPFFAWVHLYDAHAPYAPPPPYAQSYDGEIAYVDAQVARLLAAVDRAHTVVVVAGDHGESLGEHGELTHGLLLYEPALHVPLIISAPAVTPRVVRTPVSTVDVAPTIAALTGVAFSGADGRPLLTDVPSGGAIYAETEYPATLGWSPLAATRTANMKLIEGPTPELFDLDADPGEKVNVLTTRRREYHDLSSDLARLRATAVATQSPSVDEETRHKLASLGYIAPSAATSGAPRPDPRAMVPLFRRFEEATWAIDAGHAREAVPSLETLVREDPANHVFRQALARAYRQTGDARRAIALYREAVALAPQDADAWYNLASALQESGNPREAEIAIGQAARLDPNRPEVHNVRGVALAQRGDLGGAESEFRRALGADPRNARAWSNLGNVLRAMNRDDQAAEAYRKAIEIAPASADSLNGLGAILVQQGRPREAIEYFDSALRASPDLYEAQLNRAVARQVNGDSAGAADELRALLGRLPAGAAYDGPRNAARTLLSRISRQLHR